MKNYYQEVAMKKNYYQEEEEEEGVEVVSNAWSSELSTDLIGLIAEKILSLSFSEFIRFGSVCLDWRSFSIQNYQHIKLPNHQVPLLLIPLPFPDHHNNKNISSSPSSSSLCDDADDDEEELKAAEEEKPPEPPKSEEEGEEDHKAAEEEKEPEPELPEESEPEEVVVRPVRVWPQNYYNPKEIWQGQDHKQRYRSARNFYSLTEKTVYHDFPLSVPYYKNIVGSSHGWLVTVEEKHWSDDNGTTRETYLTARLFNPFRTDNNEIELPPLMNEYPGKKDKGDVINSSYFLKKAFLSANPSSLSDPTTQLVVLGVYGCNRLAFCRPGDKFWTRLNLEDYRPIMDIICYNDQFYAILQNGYVFAFVFDATQPFPTPMVTETFQPPEEDEYPSKGNRTRYLVESEGDLLQVRRNIGRLSLQESLEEIGLPTPIEIGSYITRQFLVFKLDSTGEWVEIKNLNNRMIFIGNSMSISIFASDFTGWSKPNSIYYTDHYYESFVCNPLSGPHDIGIFNLEDGSFERHYEAESKTIMPPPIWIQPML